MRVGQSERELALAINRRTINEGLTQQGDVVPVLRVDDPHRRLVEAQLPCVSLKRARDGAVRRVCEVNKALKVCTSRLQR